MKHQVQLLVQNVDRQKKENVLKNMDEFAAKRFRVYLYRHFSCSSLSVLKFQFAFTRRIECKCSSKGRQPGAHCPTSAARSCRVQTVLTLVLKFPQTFNYNTGRNGIIKESETSRISAKNRRHETFYQKCASSQVIWNRGNVSVSFFLPPPSPRGNFETYHGIYFGGQPAAGVESSTPPIKTFKRFWKLRSANESSQIRLISGKVQF